MQEQTNDNKGLSNQFVDPTLFSASFHPIMRDRVRAINFQILFSCMEAVIPGFGAG